MEWLRDKKNLPIIAGVTGLVIALVVVFLVLQMKKGSEDSQATSDDQFDIQSMMVLPDNATDTPTTPVPSATLPAGAPTFPAQEARLDPFSPFAGSKKEAVYTPPLYVPPTGRLFPPKTQTRVIEELEKQAVIMAPQPKRRMAGLLYNQRLYAILETEGESQVVKPGDITADGKARVEIIEPSRIILKTTDTKFPQTIEVKMAAADRPSDQTTTGTPLPGPAGHYGPYPNPSSMRLPTEM